MEEMIVNKNRIAYLDLIRLIACGLVVLVHVSAQRIEVLSVTSADFAITHAYNCLSFSGVALFVMISGALALNSEKETKLKTLLLHKTLRFFLLYYIWKAAYQVVSMLEKGESFTLANVKEDVLLALIQQRGYYHLWFLPMIAVLYMTVPLIKKGVSQKSVCRYFLCVFFITALLFPTLFHYEFKFKYLFVDFFSSNDFSFFGGYLGYFILGHYLHNWRNDITPAKRKGLYAAGAGCFILACALGNLASRKAGEPSYIMNTPFVVPSFFAVAAIFVGGYALCRKWEDNERVCNMLRRAADCTLGIYLLHPLAISLFSRIGFDTSICSPVLSIPLLVICVMLLCGVISLIGGKIKILSCRLLQKF